MEGHTIKYIKASEVKVGDKAHIDGRFVEILDVAKATPLASGDQDISFRTADVVFTFSTQSEVLIEDRPEPPLPNRPKYEIKYSGFNGVHSAYLTVDGEAKAYGRWAGSREDALRSLLPQIVSADPILFSECP